MDKIFNFSHPLTQQQIEDIAAKYDIAPTDITIVNIRVQLDVNEALRPQISRLVDRINVKPGDNLYIVLPGLAAAAVLIVDSIQTRGAEVNVVRFDQQSTLTGTAFPFKEIIYLGGPVNL